MIYQRRSQERWWRAKRERSNLVERLRNPEHKDTQTAPENWFVHDGMHEKEHRINVYMLCLQGLGQL
jgi:hypothetical protein